MTGEIIATHRPGLISTFNRQFGRPDGRLGWLAGQIMAAENAGLNRDLVAMLDVQPQDRVLEIGCGPGVGLQSAAKLAASGLVAGVDPSKVMVAMAIRRNRNAVRDGRVCVRRAAAEGLPFEAHSFTKAFSINTIDHWESQARGLAELRRVLAPGARLLLGLRRARGDGLDPHSRGASDEDIACIHEQLGSAGFTDIRWSEQKRRREIVAILDAS